MRECGAFLNERSVTAWPAAEVLKAAPTGPASHADVRGPGCTVGTEARPVAAGWKHTLEWLAGQVLAA